MTNGVRQSGCSHHAARCSNTFFFQCLVLWSPPTCIAWVWCVAPPGRPRISPARCSDLAECKPSKPTWTSANRSCRVESPVLYIRVQRLPGTSIRPTPSYFVHNTVEVHRIQFVSLSSHPNGLLSKPQPMKRTLLERTHPQPQWFLMFDCRFN